MPSIYDDYTTSLLTSCLMLMSITHFVELVRKKSKQSALWPIADPYSTPVSKIELFSCLLRSEKSCFLTNRSTFMHKKQKIKTMKVELSVQIKKFL